MDAALSDNKRKGSVIFSGISIAMIVAIIGVGIAYLQYNSIVKSERAQTTEVLVLIQKNLQYAFREVHSVALLLSQTIDENGEVQSFEHIASNLLIKYPSINMLEVIKDNVISHVHPPELGQNITGYNIESNARVMNELLIAFDRKALYMSGPIKLIEGKLGLIGLLPVKKVDGNITAVAVIIYFDTILKEARIDAFSDSYDFILHKYNPFDGTTDVYLNNSTNTPDLSNYASITVEEGNWTLYARQKNKVLATNVFLIICTITLIFALIFGQIAYKVFRKPHDLKILLDQKSKELMLSREKYKKNSELLNSILQSPEYIFIYSLDLEYNYLAFNRNHEELIERLFDYKIEKGTNKLETMPRHTRDQLKPYYDLALKGKPFEVTLTHLVSEGDAVYWQYWFSPIKNVQGNIEGITVYSVDITQRKEAESLIEQSLQEKTTLLSEIHHRVKNNLAIVSGLLQLQKAEVCDAKLTAIFDQSINRIISIAMVHELMYNTQDLSSINVQDYLEKLVPAISATMQNQLQNVEINVDIEEYRLNINQAIPLGLLLNELFTNSFKYAFNERTNNSINVSLVVNNDTITVVYADNGKGFPADVDFEIPKNLGLNLIHAQLQQLDADYETITEDKFEIKFHFLVHDKGSHSNIN